MIIGLDLFPKLPLVVYEQAPRPELTMMLLEVVAALFSLVALGLRYFDAEFFLTVSELASFLVWTYFLAASVLADFGFEFIQLYRKFG